MENKYEGSQPEEEPTFHPLTKILAGILCWGLFMWGVDYFVKKSHDSVKVDAYWTRSVSSETDESHLEKIITITKTNPRFPTSERIFYNQMFSNGESINAQMTIKRDYMENPDNIYMAKGGCFVSFNRMYE